MSTQDQARALMIRHHQMIKNRQQSLLVRSAAEVGIDAADSWNPLHGEPCTSCRVTYDRAGVGLS